MKKLIDPHGRHIHKLRLALLDACNFRCIYCMPQNPKFLPSKDLLKREEIKYLVNYLVNLGIDEVRLTGGEPTLRSDFCSIVEDLSKLNLKKLGFTSNGIFLKRILPMLSKTNCKHINLSLDSLEEDTFLKMTGSKNLQTVLDSLFKAKELGFNLKINAVLMKGINDHGIEKFVEFSGKYHIEVRFLELMKIGPARDKFNLHFISADEIISRLKKISTLTPINLPVDSTSFNFKLENGANIGLIASESKPFCGDCSRLRLSAKGELRPCLMTNQGISLKNKSEEQIIDILDKIMALKPTDRIYEVSQPMNQIGG